VIEGGDDEVVGVGLEGDGEIVGLEDAEEGVASGGGLLASTAGEEESGLGGEGKWVFEEKVDVEGIVHVLVLNREVGGGEGDGSLFPEECTVVPTGHGQPSGPTGSPAEHGADEEVDEEEKDEEDEEDSGEVDGDALHDVLPFDVEGS
jgi:hypothetical protein